MVNSANHKKKKPWPFLLLLILGLIVTGVWYLFFRETEKKPVAVLPQPEISSSPVKPAVKPPIPSVKPKAASRPSSLRKIKPLPEIQKPQKLSPPPAKGKNILSWSERKKPPAKSEEKIPIPEKKPLARKKKDKKEEKEEKVVIEIYIEQPSPPPVKAKSDTTVRISEPKKHPSKRPWRPLDN